MTTWKFWFADNTDNAEWSDTPGAFEQQLLRRLGNPLFPKGQRCVTAQELAKAKKADAEDLKAFKTVLAAHLRREQLINRQRVNELSAYFKEGLELVQRAMSIGGRQSGEIETLTNLCDRTEKVLEQVLQDQKASELLSRFKGLHALYTSAPILAQAERTDGPIDRKDNEAFVRAFAKMTTALGIAGNTSEH
jgi:predicted KAP-like P-loop ATPase